MVYAPMTEMEKQEWISWLKSQQNVLNGKPETPGQSQIFETPEGDVATGKDLVGKFLATLSNNEITIN